MNPESPERAEPVRARVLPILAHIRAGLTPLDQEIPADLRTLEDAEKTFAEKQTGVAEHAATLIRLAPRHHVDLTPFPAA